MLADLLPVSLDAAILLSLAAFVAGFIDAIGGGGGLIVVPALMLAGLSPAQVLATNKVQAACGIFSAAMSYARLGLIDPRRNLVPIAIATLAGFAGAALITVIPTDALRHVLPVLLIGLALFFAFRRGLGDTDRAARLPAQLFAVTLVPVVGFYDGLFGPGAGTFFMMGYVSLAGYGLLRATAHTKMVNMGSNLGSLAGFALFGDPKWALGLMMGVAALLGAALGARAAAKVGARLIRPMLVVISSAMAIRLLLG